MGDLVDPERPAKRAKFNHIRTDAHSRPRQHAEEQPQALPTGYRQFLYDELHHSPSAFLPNLPALIHSSPQNNAQPAAQAMGTNMAQSNGVGAPWPSSSHNLIASDFQQSRIHHDQSFWQPAIATTVFPSHGALPPAGPLFNFSRAGGNSQNVVQTATGNLAAAPGHIGVDFPRPAAAMNEANQPSSLHGESVQSRFPPLLPAGTVDHSSPRESPFGAEHVRRKSRSKGNQPSPFKDCVGIFGDVTEPRFARPADGVVDGYVKFRWPTRRLSSGRPTHPRIVEEVFDSEELDTSTMPTMDLGRPPRDPVIGPSPPSSAAMSNLSPTISPASYSESGYGPGTAATSSASSPVQSPSTALARVPSAKPRLLPPHFGQGAKMDGTDRRFWDFYVNNWCPGRSVLPKSNLWLNDFAQLQENDGVRAAIQSLAGVYIYDYLPTNTIRARVNERFSVAENRLTQLMNDRSLAADAGNEAITISVILSMQDVILTERRRKKPYSARWLQGFRQAEYWLRTFDQGSRFWKPNNVQIDSLRIAQSIIVGRSVILAQPMTALQPPATLDHAHEAKRFDWLLYGTREEMYEIHGGCGFSKKLLHVMSQITYLAARLLQDRDSLTVPIASKALFEQLADMRQWSVGGWEEAKRHRPPIDWVRDVPEPFIINDSNFMTAVTAEAWRIAAMVYLQCRLLRLPRNHHEVLANLDDLARCIRIMPTSGTHFTAQAPLFPVFLLGILATLPMHKNTSRDWFEKVVRTPVRSSVPPLYESLKRTWKWLDAEIELPPQPAVEVPSAISARTPWWEKLVAKIAEKEDETLCVT